MYNVVGVKLPFSNTIYYFSTTELDIDSGNKVIVETENGFQIGVCVVKPKDEKEENLVLPLKKVVRIATDADLKKEQENDTAAEKALQEAKKIAESLNLNMNFIGSNYTFDRKQLFFLYLADDRVDFRELAKKLAQKYKTRIELRQIGVRDKAKVIGGLGPCGLFLCCNSFLTDFNSVSISMAKNQFLALNPNKINGVCGRLLCCLNYEDEVYTDIKKTLPKVGSIIETKEGKGKVIGVNVLKNTYQVEINKNNIIELSGNSNDSSK